MMVCEQVPSPDIFASGMLAFLDCQAQTLGTQGYQALAAPGAVGATLLTGMIALVVAIVGYRMLLGHVPTIRDGVLTFVKIGLVSALATSWPAFQIVIYDVVLRAPAELMAAIGGAASVPGTTGGLPIRLDGVDQALKALAIQGVGQPPTGPDGAILYPNVAPPPFLGFDSFALGFSRVGFLVSAVGVFAILRLAAGLLLALGPLFVACLLFDGSRGLFEGWVKALLGTALGALTAGIVLGVELALLEPWLADLLRRRADSLDILGAPTQLLATTIVFGMTIFAVTGIAARTTFSLRIPAWFPASGGGRVSNVREVTASSGHSTIHGTPIESRSRAAAVAEAVAISQRRDASSGAISRSYLIADSQRERTGQASTSGLLSSHQQTGAAPGTNRRRVTRRLSTRAGLRDRNA